ncbi:adhesion G protein-coupled receptor A3 [Tribolium castaneum]|uniref:G-protein coupled receptor 124-like Protein n=1 Tax=Tribolium castaneum TaxID=7070 RepID=A0A139WAE3_TRICA|nr:PREDICTED: adhesion G protein-coupled receptor A3 [Tribolium castaneum]KYB24876.1 G-protein coupled receptor 124-like Protein [Tribolium castaneum]|eukprot:XP_008197674.1 PREDICTED: adhesion G protein-coupled receptor A3 [Tribolium castaneum]
MFPFLIKSLLLSIVVGANDTLCPTKCVCKRVNQRDELKLRCGEPDNKILSFEEIDLLNIANDIVQFNLSNNLLDTFFPKVQLIALQKLDLSKNRLTELQDNQFAELPNLRRLDISGNNIKSIQLLAFAKLGSLERLKLNQNQISTIALGTFNPLVSLKQLDISNNPLTCDCSLLWLLDWSQKESVKLLSNPTCNTPPSFKNLPLRKLKIGVDIHCKSKALSKGFPIIEMKPSVNQVVFEGDPLKLQCTAPSISDTYDSPLSSKIEWTWLDSDPKLYFSDITIENHFLQSTGLVVSTLQIAKLKRNHTGIWTCLLLSMQGNHSKGITIVVISDETEYCPITVTSNNKGTYTWPRTVVNYTATVPCESPNLSYDVSLHKASYFCSVEGQWENLNTSACSYTSETTKILEQFSKVNSSIVESAKHFKNYTSVAEHFKDEMDIVFAVETMENYLRYLTVNQIGGVLMDVTNNLLNLPKEYLRWADYRYGSCRKLVNISEKLAGISTTALLHKSNMATEIFPVKRNGFSSLKCTWYTDIQKETERLFYCVTNSNSDTTELPGKTIEASITIPETLFEQLEDQNYDLSDKIYNILISVYSSNKFFPIDEKRENQVDVTSPVVGAKLGNEFTHFVVTNLTDPIFVMLKIPSEEGVLTPVWWDNGTWSPDSCHFSHNYQDHVVFYCHNFGYYGLLQDVSNLQNSIIGAKFKFSHPAIYVGCFVLFTSLLVVIVIYLFAYASIQMPKKAKHSLINLWISVCLLCFLYIFGIYQTEDVRVCQIVGLCLHYLTLSSLLWMCVGVNCMYKRLSKNDVLELQDDELVSEPPVKKSIIGLYFIGWGVALIVCGISAAINIKDYASPTYCFLRSGPPLSALYIPFTILFLFLCIYFLLIRCAIYGLDANGHLSEGTQATENVDLDLLEPNFPETRSVVSESSSSEVEDPEHAPSVQLKSYIIFLFLYMFTWVCCAFATVEPAFISYQNDVFSVSFAILAFVLSVFTVFFYCIARSDVRGLWVQLRRKQLCFRSRNVSDTVQNLPNSVEIVSRSSSRSSSRTKSSNLKAAVDLNGYSSDGAKINNVNLIVLHRQQYRTTIPNIIENPTSAAEVFYNPHQSIVARKFFRRQKRHMMKRNNLVPSVKKDNSSNDQSIYGTNSKVNNTNIHVERVRKKQKNPNLFSDSGDECEIVLKKARKSKTQSENNMRSVSQQCTLEYSSENISDSILDKTSPDKECEKNDKVPTIYVNPSHDLTVRKRVQSRASSVSVSDLDELYQQIRRGPIVNSFNVTRNSPCFSDSDITDQYHREQTYLSDNVETTV